MCSKHCYNRLPEIKERKRADAAKFHHSPKGKAYREEWLARPGNREKIRASQRRPQTSRTEEAER